MEKRLKESLILLLDSIKRADGPAIVKGMAHLDALLEEGRDSLHPQLVHFLERHSYPKALHFLGGEAPAPSGSCGGKG